MQVESRQGERQVDIERESLRRAQRAPSLTHHRHRPRFAAASGRLTAPARLARPANAFTTYQAVGALARAILPSRRTSGDAPQSFARGMTASCGCPNLPLHTQPIRAVPSHAPRPQRSAVAPLNRRRRAFTRSPSRTQRGRPGAFTHI